MATIAHYDKRIGDFISALPDWQKQICLTVRRLVHAAEPEVVETVKRTSWPFFALNGNICALQATKDHINIMIYDPVAPDPEGIINQGSENKTARAIQLYEHNALNERAFTDLIKAVAKNNQAGGWRKLV